MTHRLVGQMALTLALHCGIATAQTPDFSGTWDIDTSRSESMAQAAAVSAVAGVRLVITQSPTRVTVDRQRRDGRRDEVTYLFSDPTRADVAGHPTGTSGTAVEKATGERKDNGLLLHTVLRINGQAVTTAETLRLAAGGRELHVETQAQVHHGYESNHPDAKVASPVRDVYTRSER